MVAASLEGERAGVSLPCELAAVFGPSKVQIGQWIYVSAVSEILFSIYSGPDGDQGKIDGPGNRRFELWIATLISPSIAYRFAV